MADSRGFTQAAPGAVVRANRNSYRNLATTPEGALFTADYLNALAREGRVFTATPGAANNTGITGVATSFSATTPDFTLEVPSGTTCIPVRIQMSQTGTVAGGAISVIIAVQNAIERSSAGTVFPNILSTRTDGAGITRACVPYTAPTVATDTVGVAIYRTILTQSVTTGRTGGMATDLDLMFGQDLPMQFLVGVSALKI